MAGPPQRDTPRPSLPLSDSRETSPWTMHLIVFTTMPSITPGSRSCRCSGSDKGAYAGSTETHTLPCAIMTLIPLRALGPLHAGYPFKGLSEDKRTRTWFKPFCSSSEDTSRIDSQTLSINGGFTIRCGEVSWKRLWARTSKAQHARQSSRIQALDSSLDRQPQVIASVLRSCTCAELGKSEKILQVRAEGPG